MIDVPVRVKDALKSGQYKKNYKFIIFRGELQETTLDNTYIVSESVKIDERMCSGTDLKFGLCEGSSLEFQYFNYQSILGCRINAKVSVQYKDSNNALQWYDIPMGWFDVQSCSRQASTGIIKVTAYNKLKSSYLDKPANAQILALFNNENEITIHKILDSLLSGYGVEDYGEVNITTDITYEHGTKADYAHAFYVSYATTYGEQYRRETNGKRFAVYYTKKVAQLPAEWTSDKFYKFALYVSNVYGIMNENFLQGLDDYLDSVFIWTGTNMGVQMEENAGVILRQYIYNEYEYSRFFKGFYRIETTTDGLTTFHDYPIYNGFGRIQYTYYVDYLTNIATTDGAGIKVTIFIPAFYNADYTIDNDSIVKVASKEISDEITDAQAQTILANTDNSVYYHALLSCTWGSNVTSVNTIRVTKEYIASITNNITLRDLQTASFELECEYGKLDRETDIFSGIKLGNGYLYPADDLYPANDLYPNGSVEGGYPAMYSKLWADENNVRSFRYLIITYKGTETIDGQVRTVDKTLQRTVNADGTDDYNMTNNWLFRNLIWTEEQIGRYADSMKTKMQNIRWFPFEMWCAGLPYLEAGDQIEIWAADGVHPSYILSRTLDGIQNLQDTMINGTLDIF